MLKKILDFSHQLLNESVTKGDTVIDATAGNGNDTLFLSELVGNNGHVLAFDIQDQAIEIVNKKLNQLQIGNTQIIHDGHENAVDYLKENELLSGAIFNLGYLPGSDKSIITHSESTIAALQGMLSRLKKGGIIVLVVYYGHEGGMQEKDALLNFVKTLDQHKYNVLQYNFINQKNNPPFIVAVESK